MKAKFSSLLIALAVGLWFVPIDAQSKAPSGQVVTWTTNSERSWPIDATGSLAVENPVGRIWVEAADVDSVKLAAKLVVRGVDQQVVASARERLKIHTVGNRERRTIRLIGWDPRIETWAPRVDLRIKVPRELNLTLNSAFGELISVEGVRGEMAIKTYKGDIVIREPYRALVAESINGDIRCELTSSPRGSMKLSTVNGSVALRAPQSARFEWAAETLNGTIRGPISLRGSFQENRPTLYTASVGTAGRSDVPRIITASTTGDVLLSNGSETRPVIRPESADGDRREELGEMFETVVRNLIARPTTTQFAVQRRTSRGDVRFETKIGNIFIGEHQGNARLSTGAGEIVAGRILGSLAARTMGGPINVGQVTGRMELETEAGDIYVVAAPRGGSARTGGGSIAVRTAGGPTTFYSGGGDILVDRALADVTAVTESGDVRITLGQQGRFAKSRLETREGNVVLIVPANVGADIDITLLVDNEMANVLVSQFEGLSVVRDRYQGRGRIRAIGSINGGGPKFELVAADGQVHLLRQ